MLNMTLELFDGIINTSQDCVFWKDKERRFLGVNQAFLDFYGFESADILLGKTDEDMGWHNDPEPYKEDELRVLGGGSTYKVQGKCVVRGEERDIIASKRPLFENGEIVGLVGSFVDITDVLRRRNQAEDVQVVYTIDSLRPFSYWDKLLDEISLDEMIDPLTGLISRKYAHDYINSLIASETPFSFAILDLDNFKFINDGYGHAVGDIVLKAVSKSLAEYMQGFGIVARYGGDELLIINLRDVNPVETEIFFNRLYASHKVFRRNIVFEGGYVFITCTAGCASFPIDSGSFSDLFTMTDKALYLGKTKGRNCYTVYHHEKHKDIEIKKLSTNNVFSNMVALDRIVKGKKDPLAGLEEAIPFLEESLHIGGLFYLDKEGNLKSIEDNKDSLPAGDVSNCVKEALYACSSLSEIKKDSPVFYKTLKSLQVESFVVAKVNSSKADIEYIVLATGRKHRIWQENECALIYFLTTLI